VVLAVDPGAHLFSPPGPLGDLGVVLPLVRFGGRYATELAPDAEGDERPRIPDHQHRLQQQLLDPADRNLAGAQRPHPLAQLRLVALRDGRREADQVPGLLVETAGTDPDRARTIGKIRTTRK